MCLEEQVSVSLTLQYFIFILNYLFQRILSNSVASGDSGNFLGRTRSPGPVCTAQLPQASRVLPLLGMRVGAATRAPVREPPGRAPEAAAHLPPTSLKHWGGLWLLRAAPTPPALDWMSLSWGEARTQDVSR